MKIAYKNDSDVYPKHIFVTGGVVSSLGKGLTAASLGQLLSARGLVVSMQKLDPYLNVDPGTMNPFQHGEVFVTEDGAETDLDIGHYERFLNKDLPGNSNITTGQIYSKVIARERRGEYLGDTVQVIPHITDEIITRILAMNTPDKQGKYPDIIITEIGGTVGDIESQPFIESARQIRHALGAENVLFIHVSLVPYLVPSGELKTKPTQHSVQTLRSAGITPDVIVLRSDRLVSQAVKQKIALMCDVSDAGVVSAPDAKSIYDIPQVLHQEKLDAYIVEKLNLTASEVDWEVWGNLAERVHKYKHTVRIGLVGKYIDLPDAYLSVIEALRAGGFTNWSRVEIVWIKASDCQEEDNLEKLLTGISGIIIPGGFGVRGIEGMIKVVYWAREKRIPFLGICLGLQCVVIEAARAAGLADANSTEFELNTPFPVIDTMAAQKKVVAGELDLGGTMRLGAYQADLIPDSLAAQLYGTVRISERHRHRYEVNNTYKTQLQNFGLIFSGTNPETGLIEFVEYSQNEHPFFIATQAHPELKSRPTDAHPLFTGFIAAALEYQQSL